MKRTRSGQEVPSVIKEIVIYDKPNKPFVPYDIFPEPNLGQDYSSGDIVLSRAKGNNSSNSASKRGQIDIKVEPPTEIKEEPNDEEIVDNPTEIGEEEVNENASDIEESIENISKEIHKLARKQPAKRAKKVIERPPILRTYSRRKTHPVDKPEANEKQQLQHNQSKSTTADASSQESTEPKKIATRQSTILNFLIKPPSDKVSLETSDEFSIGVENSTEDTPGSEDSCSKNQTPIGDTTESNFKSEGRHKRVRKIPKKYQDDILLGDSSLNNILNGDEICSSPKKKKYTELKAVPYNCEEIADDPSSNSDNIESLFTDSEEQVRDIDEVEAELEKLVSDNDKSVKSKKRSAINNVHSSLLTQTKQNAVEETIKIEEFDEELADRAEEDDDSDDSRQEWLPDEYVEYKRQHVLKKTAPVHKCKFCHMAFNSYYAMRKHRAFEHDDVGNDSKKSTQKNPARTRTETQLGIAEESDEESREEWLPEDYAEYKLKHKMKKYQVYKCKICCTVFSNYYKLSKHRLEHEKQCNPYDCKLCDAKFKDVETLTAHIRNHQGKDPYSCKKCDKGFLSKQELTKHEEVHVLKKAPAPEKRYRCEVCAKEFHKLCDIERHTRVHTGEKPSQCTICQKRFQQPYNLSKHLLTHLHVKPFQCEICNKKFGRIDVLNRHLLTHSIEKPFKCVICGKGFIRQVQLNNHMDKSHPGLTHVTSIDEVSITPVV